MDNLRPAFERMQEALLRFVDQMNTAHDQGVDFGIGRPLSPAEIHTVAAIGDHQGIGVTRLAALMRVSKPTISERVKRLVAKDVVEKRTNPSDAKAVTLWLTPDGKTAVEHHEALHQRMYEIFFNHFGTNAPATIKLFHKTFTLAAQWAKACNEPKP